MKTDKSSKKKIAKALILLAVLIVVVVFVKNAVCYTMDYSARQKKYETAVSYYDAGKTDEARAMFFELGDYKDSKAYTKEFLSGIKKGDTLYFGSFEQDGDFANGSEPVEWIVLETNGDKALLLSKYCLTQYVFDGSGNKTNWEKSDMRKWLNSGFAEAVFTKAQFESYVHEAEIENEKNSKYGGNEQKNTYDKLFLLSEKEFNTYVAESDKVAYATPNLNKTYYTKDGKCMYWLRTTGGNELNAVNVSFEGTVNEIGYIGNHGISEKHPDIENQSIGYGSFGVRPAMWINLN